MRRTITIFLFLALASCATAPATSHAPVHVVVVGTTDVHGWFNGHDRDNPKYGGLAVLAAYVNALRAANENRVLLVDSGDLYQGTLESNLFEGEPVTRAYNALGYSAAAVGNHEFDYGPVGPNSVPRSPGDNPLGALEKNAQLAKWPFLSANLQEKATGNTPSWAKKSAIFEVAGARIGVIGLSTPDTPNVTVGANIVDLAFTDPVAATLSEAQKLRAAGADAVIVIAHMGGKCGDMNDVNDVASCVADEDVMRYLRALPPGTIDAYFAGHTHQQVRQIINGVPTVQALAYSHSFSTIDFWIDHDAHRVTKTEIRPHTMLCTNVFAGTDTCDPRRLPKNTPQPALVARTFEGKQIVPDAKIAALLAPYLEKVSAKRNEKTGIRIAAKLTRNYEGESQIGDLFADAIRAATKSDLAFVNSGSLRNDLPPGDLIYSDIFEVQPFDNYVAVLTMTGAEVADALRANASQERGLMQVSGLRYVKEKHQINSITLANGQPLDPNATYRVAMPDFLAQGGDGLLPVTSKMPPERISVDQNRPMRDVLIDTLKQWPQPISVTTDGRVTVVAPPK